MKAGEAKLKYLGRTLTDADGTIWCALSGSGVRELLWMWYWWVTI